MENNRPYLIPRLPHKYDASNVETTAYALLVHVKRQAVIQKEIVHWLNTQRSRDGGWSSTQVFILRFLIIKGRFWFFISKFLFIYFLYTFYFTYLKCVDQCPKAF